MADYGAIADAIAARFLGTTPPTGQPAIRLATADLPNGITATPCFLVFEPDDDWGEQGMGRRHGTLTFPCRLVLARADEPRTTRAMLDWRSALHTRLDGTIHLGLTGSGVGPALVSRTASGTLTYAGSDWACVELTVVVTITEAMTAVA